MNAWIETLTFTAVGDPSVTYDFNGENTNILMFDPKPAPRGSSRPRMQAHGMNPRRTIFGGLEIAHEGVFGPADSQTLVVAERDALLAALLGDLSASPSDETNMGTLTVKYLGWSESASGLVSIDSYAFAFGASDVLTLAYQIQWRCDQPYFVGNTSGDPVLL